MNLNLNTYNAKEDEEIAKSIREGIKAKYNYTDEQVISYCKGLEDSFKEYNKIINIEDILKRVDNICICLSNVYNTGHTIQVCDYETIIKQCENIKANIKGINRRCE